MDTSYEDTPTSKARDWLAKRLKMDDVPEPLWELLLSKNYVSEALQFPNEKEEVLLKPAKELLRFSTDMGASPGRERARKETADTSSYVPPPLPGDPVWERAHAAAPYLLKRLETHPVVAEFRRRLGAPLSQEEARELLRSPESASGSGSLVHARLFFDGKHTFGVDVEEGSLLWELHDSVDRLPPGPWRPERVTWWLLTGERPEVQPLQAEVRLGLWPTVTLTIPAWTPAEAVGEFHKETKDNVWPVPPALTPSPRRLAVFRFVVERGEFSEASGNFEPRFSWRKLMELWNQWLQELPANHEWHYADVRNFRRDFREAKKALFGDEDFLASQRALLG